MRPNRVIALTMGIAFVAAFGAGASGCFLPKKVKDVPDDIRQCFGPDVKGAIGDLVKGIETALVCELSSGGQALPACVIEGLQTVAEEIGPSGKADVQCVIDKIAKDAAARVGKTGLTPDEVVRDQRAKMLSKRGVFLSLRSPGDGKPPAPPASASLGAPLFAKGTTADLAMDLEPVPLLVVRSDWKSPAECRPGTHNVIAVQPGAVCMRDGATWADVSREIRKQGLAELAAATPKGGRL